MEVQIKKASIDNLKAIINLNQKLFDNEYKNFDKTLDCSWPAKNKKYFKESIKGKDTLALVVIMGEEVVGYAIGRIRKARDSRKIFKIAELENIFVLPECRSKGIGCSLCEKFFKWADEKGIKRAKVRVSAKNKRAIEYYKKCGFSDHDLVLEIDL
jgi:ribosomal protein S18 acetylase RimI-like enzyme